MTTIQIYNNYISKRDYSGSPADEYAQLLITIQSVIGDQILPLLKQAENDNKKLSIRDTSDDFEFAPQLTIDDIIIS